MAKINHHTTAGSKPLADVLLSILADITALKTAVDSIDTLATELRVDHATFKTVVTSLKTSLNSTLTKLDADSGVTDTNYSATLAVTDSAPATLAASAPTATGSLSTS